MVPKKRDAKKKTVPTFQKKQWDSFFSRKAHLTPTEAYTVIWMQERVNLDHQNFGLRNDFSIFIWRFHESGKFIFALFIFPGKIMQQIFGKA